MNFLKEIFKKKSRLWIFREKNYNRNFKILNLSIFLAFRLTGQELHRAIKNSLSFEISVSCGFLLLLNILKNFLDYRE